ncbi:hypothetical protein GCM10023081_19940 [Arthrobacter ginkgonis]|uniref:Recombinase n=2 Tax=Arthrobacter ginkgonis TaxID=1630594 RepID=A0ABP7CBJ1_9MICC
MLDAMRAGSVQAVITWHTDRLHRSPKELEEYIDVAEAGGIMTRTVKAGELDLGTASGRAVARTLGAWDRFESEHKSERITRKKRELAHAGKLTGGPVPFGWELDAQRRPVIVEAEAAEIRRAVAAISAGESIGSVVRDLNGRGVATKRGQAWTSTSVRNLVMRPTNAGLSVYRGEVVGESIYPPIVTEDQWRAAKAVVTNPNRRSQTDSRVKHVLAGMLRCGTCGEPMKTSSRARNTSETRHYYKCSTPGSGHAFQTAAPVEDLVSRVVVARLSDPEVRRRLAAPGDRNRMASLQNEAVALRGRLAESADSYADGHITAAQLAAITARVTTQLDNVNGQLAALGAGSSLPGPEISDVAAWWEAASIEKRRAVIDALMTVTVMPIRKAAPRTFDPERIKIEWKA